MRQARFQTQKKTNHFYYIALGIRSESFRTIWNKPKYTADKQYLQYEKYAVQSYLSILTYCLLMLPIVGTHELAVSCIESDSEKLIKMYLCHNVRFHVHIKNYNRCEVQYAFNLITPLENGAPTNSMDEIENFQRGKRGKITKCCFQLMQLTLDELCNTNLCCFPFIQFARKTIIRC